MSPGSATFVTTLCDHGVRRVGSLTMPVSCAATLGGCMDMWSPNARRTWARSWAIAGAVFLVAGAGLLFRGGGLLLQLFGLVLLGSGAKALWVGVELQAGGDPAGRQRLVRLLTLNAGILATLAVARVMGSWR